MSVNAPPILRQELMEVGRKGLGVSLGLWAYSALPQYWYVGAGLAGMAALSMIYPLYRVGVARRYRRQQKQWAYESKKRILGRTSRLGRIDDAFLQPLRAGVGYFVGALGSQKLFYPLWGKKAGHVAVIAPPRTGKSSLLMGTLLNLGRTMQQTPCMIWVNDIKKEIHDVCAPYLRSIGIEVEVWNPFGMEGLPQTHMNWMDPVRRSVAIEDGRARDFAALIAETLIPEPDSGSSDNTYFRNGAKALLITLMLYLCVFEPYQAHFVRLRELVNASDKRLLEVANRMRDSDRLNGLIHGMGVRLLENLRPDNAKTFGSFRQECEFATDLFDPSTVFAQSLVKSDFPIEHMFKKGKVVFELMPKDYLGTHGRYKALSFTMMMESYSRLKTPLPFALLHDEIANGGKIPPSTANKILSLLPGHGCRWIHYWQDLAQIKMTYGEHMSKLFLNSSSMLQCWAVREPELAAELSRRSGKTTRKKYSYNRDSDQDYAYKKTSDEIEEAVLSETEILQMPSDQQVISMSGQKSLVARLTPFWMTRSWRLRAAPNPCEPQDYPKEDKIEWED